MKKYLFFLAALALLWSCEKDESKSFDVTMPASDISFSPYAGGAVMHYILPDNPDIFSIKVKYNDFKGKPVVVRGSYLNTSVVLHGFVDAESNVPAEVCLVDNKGNQSAVTEVTFNTAKSAALAFFEDLEVAPYWNGFSLKYNAPENPGGFVHVSYLGTNPFTNERDTLLIKTIPIQAGENMLRYPDYADTTSHMTTVVVRTEDFRGNVVKTQVYKDVEAVFWDKAAGSDFQVIGSSEENETLGMGVKYLFDGDTKGVGALASGEGNWQAGRINAFVSQSYAFPGEWIIDMKEAKSLAAFRLYAPLRIEPQYAYPVGYYGMAPLIPSHFKLYGSNDQSTWDELEEFFQPAAIHEDERWSYAASNPNQIYSTVTALEGANPCFTAFNFDVDAAVYRYLKLEVIETFWPNLDLPGYSKNNNKRVAIQEMEIYVKK